MRTALRVLLARIRRRPLELEGVDGTGHRTFMLTPKGQIMPPICGADGEDDPPVDPPTPTDPPVVPLVDPPEDPPPAPPLDDGPFDAERARRLIENERTRAAEKLQKANAKAAAAEARAKALEQEQETEHETARRERDEAKVEAERLRANSERVAIDVALRDAAADADVPAKKIKRLVRLVDREDLSVDEQGEVDGAPEAVVAFLEEFPEFKGERLEDPPADPPPEPPGGNPNRREKSNKELTTEQVTKLAKEDPDKFNELYDAGKIPASALSGVK